MSLLPAPDADYLRHDAGKVGIHDAGIQSSRGAPGHDIDDPDMEFSHAETQSSAPAGSPSESKGLSASRKSIHGRIITEGRPGRKRSGRGTATAGLVRWSGHMSSWPADIGFRRSFLPPVGYNAGEQETER